jgi:hypothetical protein
MFLPVAMSSAGWTAIGAVGGALVGALAGGIADWAISARREAALAKAGARLIANEIAGAESQIAIAADEGKWWRFYGSPIDSWPEYRSVIAGRLDAAQFEAVSQAVAGLERIRQLMPESPPFASDPDRAWVDVSADALEPMRRDAAAAVNALAKLAEHKRVGDLIERPPSPPGGGS